jgi:predicted Rossmann fold nucleotide-binding protein DprA/Smf involved in DNA uptake
LGTIRRSAASRSAPKNLLTSLLSLSHQRRRGADERRPEPEDRLRATLRRMPGSFTTARAARAAGVNKKKALARLHDLERRGEVYRVGERWSTQPPASDLASAMDRLEAQTSNLRIVRGRPGVG